MGSKMLDARLPGKENSQSHGTRPVHLIITMIKWIRTSRLLIKESLSVDLGFKGIIGNSDKKTTHDVTVKDQTGITNHTFGGFGFGIPPHEGLDLECRPLPLGACQSAVRRTRHLQVRIKI